MSNINFELYKIFYTVAVHKNITKAAKGLYISQPAVTQHLKRLEDEVGYKLFYRTRQGVEFTNEGKQLFESIKYPIESLNNIKYDSNCDTKKISFGGPYITLRALLENKFEIIKKIYSEYNIKVLKVRSQEITEKVLNNVIDIGFISSPVVFNENIKYIELDDFENILVCGKQFSEYNDRIITFEELKELPLILLEKTASFRKLLDTLFEKNNIYIEPKYEVTSYEMVVEFIKKGFGFGVVNKELITSEIEAGNVIKIKTNFKFPKRKRYIMVNKNSINRKDINKMIEIITKDVNKKV